MQKDIRQPAVGVRDDGWFLQLEAPSVGTAATPGKAGLGGSALPLHMHLLCHPQLAPHPHGPRKDK